VWPTDGADGSVSSEARWRKMARLWVPSGVDDSPLGIGGTNPLAPTLVAGPTINVTIGSCWLDGHFAELATPASVPATANGLLVVRFTPADNHAELLYRDTATVPTQTLATWELPIAQMTAGALTDLRRFSRYGGLQPVPTCILQAPGGIVIPTGTAVVAFSASTELVDTHNMHDGTVNPSRITAPLRGIYAVKASAVWGSSNTGNYRFIKIQQTGNQITAHRHSVGLAGASPQEMDCS